MPLTFILSALDNNPWIARSSLQLCFPTEEIDDSRQVVRFNECHSFLKSNWSWLDSIWISCQYIPGVTLILSSAHWYPAILGNWPQITLSSSFERVRKAHWARCWLESSECWLYMFKRLGHIGSLTIKKWFDSLAWLNWSRRTASLRLCCCLMTPHAHRSTWQSQTAGLWCRGSTRC